MADSGGNPDPRKITLGQIAGWISHIFSWLDKLCPEGQMDGKILVGRGLCAMVGFGMPLAVYVAAHWWAKSSLTDIVGFFQQFPVGGYIAILFIFCVIGLAIGHDKKQSYCICLVRGTKWGVMFAIGVLAVAKGVIT